MSQLTRLVSRLAVYSGLAAFAERRQRARLTILAYHRIGVRSAGPAWEDGELFSASPQGFEWQMDYLKRHFQVLSFDQLLEAWQQGQPLPDRSALITFDDGYRDNYTLAAPILRRQSLPAVIFLTTGFLDGQQSLWWDELAGMLAATRLSSVLVPGLGELPLGSPEQRRSAQRRLRNWLKGLADSQRLAALRDLRRRFGDLSALPESQPEPMSWAEARQLQGQGIDFGAHTRTHAILTRLPLEEAAAEICDSKLRIEQCLERRVDLFAYPNGQPGDFNSQTRDLLAQQGFRAAVTLVHGSNRLCAGDSRAAGCADPLELRRIYIGSDDRASFIAKVSGALEMLDQARGQGGAAGGMGAA